jgi:lipoprotein-releasing system ATP-binding protein
MSDLSLANISKTYPGAEGPLEILRGVNLEMNRGDSAVITGPSGSGKSTLLYIVGTLDQPTRGTVQILGQDPFSLGTSALARFRNRHIGFVFQDHCLLPQCTVEENVLIPTLPGTGAGKIETERAKQLLDRVGLGTRLGHRPGQLSGGERQRVAICRALINQPPLLLADEPTGNLDQTTAQSVGSLLLELCREQNAVLITVTHSAELAARFPRRLALENGTLVDRS